MLITVSTVYRTGGGGGRCGNDAARRPPQDSRPIGTFRLAKGGLSSSVVGLGGVHFKIPVGSITQCPGHLSTEVDWTEFFRASAPVHVPPHTHSTSVHVFLLQPKAPHRSLTTMGVRADLHTLGQAARTAWCCTPGFRTQGPCQHDASVAISAQVISIDRLAATWSKSLKPCT